MTKDTVTVEDIEAVMRDLSATRDVHVHLVNPSRPDVCTECGAPYPWSCA